MLLNLLKKAAGLGFKLLKGAKHEAECAVKELRKKGLLSQKQANKLLKKLLKEANMERKEFQKFMKKEIDKELKKAKKLIKKKMK